MPRYHGSCHCGAVRFEVEADIHSLTACNCSVCLKKGILHHRVAAADFRLLSGATALAEYRFGTRVAVHYFCRHCGIHPFTRPRAAPHLYTINVRCLDDFDWQDPLLTVQLFDGRHWERQYASWPD
jgi:hypothetical protein